MKKLERKALDVKIKVKHTKIKKYNVWKNMPVKKTKDTAVLLSIREINQEKIMIIMIIIIIEHH